jgi:hypothetical protein
LYNKQGRYICSLTPIEQKQLALVLRADNTLAVSGEGSENMLHSGKNTAGAFVSLLYSVCKYTG